MHSVDREMSGAIELGHIPIEETELFKRYETLSGGAWASFAQRTVLEQPVRSIESVGAHMSEGGGRYNGAEARFVVIARASEREARHLLKRGVRQGLIQSSDWLNTEPSTLNIEFMEEYI
jgi:four helix bundle protein